MIQTPKSTSNYPLLFLETFLKQNYFDAFENDFYDNPINPSFVSYRDQGYIEYIDCEYLNEDVIPRKVYFKDKVLEIIKLQVNKSIQLIKDKADDIEISGNSASNYISKTKLKISDLLTGVSSYNKLQLDIIPYLKDINKTLISLGNGKIEAKRSIQITNSKQGLFKPLISRKKLILIYELALELGILDENVVFEDDFITVFTHPSPKQVDSKIVFNKDNRITFYFINNIKMFFDNLTPSAIDRSKSFYSKQGTLLKQGAIDGIDTFLRKNDVSRYKEILSEIQAMAKKHNF
ncbi:hypothetical protein H8R23_03345 [Flavobacterium sp. F-380]|uniref:Uncharacterized protein n=1 Tax=Flavobacterium kayseriense TaxID=2764714 RepID=A0ABR7J522_9FLAO|nr:DUF6617 family protein [Flavobacterium kayseriense]MBC5840429.1 hypothetical protein [Flavobacterium kayseriense]MBC5846901.1 hypothetical protein [Flavobacterium kayseriense]